MRFRKFLNPYKTRDSSFREYTINIGEIESILEFAEKARVNKVSFLGLVPHGRASDNMQELVLNTNENEDLKLKLETLVSDKV